VADACLIYLVLRGERRPARWPLPAGRPSRGCAWAWPRHYFHDVLDDTCGPVRGHRSRGFGSGRLDGST